MLLLVRRHFWALGVACVLLCGVLAADAASHILEARAFEAPPPSPPIEAAEPTASAPSRDGTALAERNMFCSTCTLEPPEDPGPDDREAPATPLPLDVLATSVSARPEHSLVTVRHRDSGHQGAFGVGDVIPGAGTVERIGGRSIEVRHHATERLERVWLAGVDQPQDRAGDDGDEDERVVADTSGAGQVEGVRSVDETTFEVDRTIVTNLISNPRALAGARARPVERDGELKGFQVFNVRPGTPLDAIGLKNGDLLEAINGMQPRSPDEMLSVYTRLQSAETVTLSVSRRGTPVTLTYRMM